MKHRIAAAFVFGCFVFALLPNSVVAVNDDFGYLRSVLQTAAHHHPWTDDWLEPWAASLSALSWMLFHLTGSFYLATYGVLAGCAAVSYFSLATLLATAEQGSRSLMVTAFLLTGATILWKFLEFTSVALYVACLLTAIVLAERRRWLLFTVVWCIGMAARQSAIAWGIMPLLALIDLLRERHGRFGRRALAVFGALTIGGAFMASMRMAMNVTHAQAVLGSMHLAAPDLSRTMRTAGIGVAAVGVVLGISGLLRAPLRFEFRRQTAMRALLVLPIAIVLLICDERTWVGIEHTCYVGTRGNLYIKLAIVCAACGAIFGCTVWRPRYLIYSLTALLLLATRAMTWDYYFIDCALFAFLSIDAAEPAGEERAASWVKLGTIACLLIFHATFAFTLKTALDRASALIAISERAIRAGKLDPADLSFAPFGLIGWYWYPRYAQEEGAASAQIDGFGIYLKQDAIDVGQAFAAPLQLLPQFRHTAPADRTQLIESGRARFLWVFWSEFYLLRAPENRIKPAAVRVKDYVPLPFPLNDREWRALEPKLSAITKS